MQQMAPHDAGTSWNYTLHFSPRQECLKHSEEGRRLWWADHQEWTSDVVL